MAEAMRERMMVKAAFAYTPSPKEYAEFVSEKSLKFHPIRFKRSNADSAGVAAELQME